MKKLKLESKSLCEMPSRRFVYEVDNERERHMVDLVKRTCSCRTWDLTRIPCKHRVATIFVNVRNQKTALIHDTTRMLLWRHTKHSYLLCLASLSGCQVANPSLLHLLSISHQVGHP